MLAAADLLPPKGWHRLLIVGGKEGAMAFRVKNLMITLLPTEAGGIVERICHDVTIPVWETDGGPGGGGGGGGCGNAYSCIGCTNTCDAGCSRVQCSEYPTNNFAPQMVDIQAAQLLLLRAELRLALQGRPREPIAAMTDQPVSPEDIDLLEKHLTDALEELRQERDRLANASAD